MYDNANVVPQSFFLTSKTKIQNSPWGRQPSGLAWLGGTGLALASSGLAQ